MYNGQLESRALFLRTVSYSFARFDLRFSESRPPFIELAEGLLDFAPEPLLIGVGGLLHAAALLALLGLDRGAVWSKFPKDSASFSF